MCDKIKYNSYREAQKFLRLYRKTKQGRKLKRVYKCPECNMFHLTKNIDIDSTHNVQYLKYIALEKETRL